MLILSSARAGLSAPSAWLIPIAPQVAAAARTTFVSRRLSAQIRAKLGTNAPVGQTASRSAVTKVCATMRKPVIRNSNSGKFSSTLC